MEEEFEKIKTRLYKLIEEGEELIEKYRKETEDKPWRARTGETYYEVAPNDRDRNGAIRAHAQVEADTNYDTNNYEAGNYFRHEWEAEKVAQHFNDYLILWRDTKGYEPTPEVRTCFYVEGDVDDGCVYVCGAQNTRCGLHFETEEEARASIKKHEEIWKRYLGVNG